jgi:histidine triad (HIT) family protein
MTEPDCIFCQIVAGELPAQIVAQDERTISFMDIFPGAAGHALVIPRTHVRNIYEVEPEDLTAVMLAAQRLAVRVRDRLGADGVNLVNSCEPAAGQTVFHFHVHVLPRYENDSLRMMWHPAPGDADEIARLAEELR